MNKTLFKQSILMLSFLFSVGFAFSQVLQAPEKFSYQSVIRRTNNDLVVNQNFRVKISILQGTITGTAVYVEDHTTSTNSNGLVSLSIGGGNVISGTFSAINWENGPYFVKMEADPTGGTNYTVSGTSQLLSVPYALYAKTSGSSTPGPQGAQGIQGVSGINGTNGTNGVDGKNTLVKTTTEVAGANCATGGVKIEYGIDTNNDGTLDISEVNTSLTRYVCNGADGSPGAQGLPGLNGTNGTNGTNGVIYISNPGTTNFTVPTGVNSIKVSIVGAGGGCGKNTSNGNLTTGGGGGGYFQGIILVNPGDILKITVGNGGLGFIQGNTITPGTDGGVTKIVDNQDNLLLTLNGGKSGGNGGVGGNIVIDNTLKVKGFINTGQTCTPASFNSRYGGGVVSPYSESVTLSESTYLQNRAYFRINDTYYGKGSDCNELTIWPVQYEGGKGGFCVIEY